MSIRITGITARDTFFTVAPNPDARVRVHVEVHTGERHHAVARAVLLVGQGASAAIAAANVAHHLKRGRRVTVYGAGLDLLHGHLVVVGCDRVTPDDAVARQHLEQGATA